MNTALKASDHITVMLALIIASKDDNDVPFRYTTELAETVNGMIKVAINDIGWEHNGNPNMHNYPTDADSDTIMYSSCICGKVTSYEQVWYPTLTCHCHCCQGAFMGIRNVFKTINLEIGYAIGGKPYPINEAWFDLITLRILNL